MILSVSEICAKVDGDITTFVHNFIMAIKIAVPVVLVIFGMFDLSKGVVAGKEDEIKKGQSTFLKRLIAGIVVFFMVSLTQLLVALIDKESDGDIWACANAIMNGENKSGSMWSSGDQYDLNEAITNNPSTFQYCCESLDGSVLDGACKTPTGKDVSKKKLAACTNSANSGIRNNFVEETKACCQSLGGGYMTGECKDHNGGSISEDKVNECIVGKIKTTKPDLYKYCCEAKGGHYGESTGCVDSNGGSIGETTINSCMINQYN